MISIGIAIDDLRQSGARFPNGALCWDGAFLTWDGAFLTW